MRKIGVLIHIISKSYLLRKGIKSVNDDVFSNYKSEEYSLLSEIDLNNILIPDIIYIDELVIEKNNITEVANFKILKPDVILVLIKQNSSEFEEIFDFVIDINEEKSELLKKIRSFISTEKSINSELSYREIDIIKLVAIGMTNNEIAEKLFISTHTVISHRKNITRKLGIKTVSGLTIYAVLNGIINTNEVI